MGFIPPLANERGMFEPDLLVYSGCMNDAFPNEFPPERGEFADYPAPMMTHRRRTVLPIVLFLLTCISTFVVGACQWDVNILFETSLVQQSLIPVRKSILSNWDIGLIYMAAVLLILLLHEFGHFFMTLLYKVPASFPFFLPFPANPIGTMGAVIAMQGNAADRKEIFDIGIAGPLAGLVAAVPIAWYGMADLDLTSSQGDWIGFHLPLLMQWFADYLQVPGYSAGSIVWLNQLNPLFVAGWVGLLITGLNMMPIGQLDGGHITYTLFGKAAHSIARITMVIAIAFMTYQGAPTFALMIVLLLLMGTDHPPTRDDSVKLGPFRWVLGLVSLTIPILCFPPLVMKISGS